MDFIRLLRDRASIIDELMSVTQHSQIPSCDSNPPVPSHSQGPQDLRGLIQRRRNSTGDDYTTGESVIFEDNLAQIDPSSNNTGPNDKSKPPALRITADQFFAESIRIAASLASKLSGRSTQTLQVYLRYLEYLAQQRVVYTDETVLLLDEEFRSSSDDRVDFRELIRVFAGDFKVKVEMRQIGARQEAGKVGGIGSCGRELCCSTWLTDFKSVNTQAARYQNLSINQTKLSGQCGRLKCCLNYELDTYLDALKFFPENAEDLMTTRGKAYLVKKDIFKNLMWYTLPDSSKQYPLAISRVKEIKEQNAKGIAVEELQPVEIVSSKQVEKEPEFVELVGQITLKSLDKNSRRGNSNRPPQGFNDRNREGGGNQNRNQRQGPPNQQQQQPPQQNQRPPQQGQRPLQQGQRPPQQGGQQQRPPQNQQRPPQNPSRGAQQQRPPQNQQRPPQQKPPQGDGPKEENK